jgi:hypothetical protein
MTGIWCIHLILARVRIWHDLEARRCRRYSDRHNGGRSCDD